MTESSCSRSIECLPGESDEDFIARIVATSGKPDTELAEFLRGILPPVARRDRGELMKTELSQVPVKLTAGTDGALWVTVDGADVQQITARINAVCDVLIKRPPW
jgi:hypothetical protein